MYLHMIWFSVIFGKDHPSHVRGLSYRACPTFVFQQSTTRLSDIKFASFSATSPNMEDKVLKMKSELATIKNQMHTLFSYISLREDVL